MITLIIKSYFAIFLALGIGCLLAFILGLYCVFKKPRKQIIESLPALKPKPRFVLTATDISSIAGDDVMATRLDLARAYVETGKRKLAKQILESVAKQGTSSQQEEALYLLSTL
jgi:FimV-like protein